MSICRTVLAASVALMLITLISATAMAEPNWAQWRGPTGKGHSNEKNLPVRWTNDNVVWRAELEGVGQSSPTIWGDRIYLTSSVGKGTSRVVMCLDRKSGKRLWRHVAWTGNPNSSHAMNHWASATCVTDGDRVVAFFGKGGLHCLDMDGKPLWSRQLGDFSGPWGTAASPIIVGDMVIQNCDADDVSTLLAVDKHSGKTVWKTSRYTVRGWSTPIVIQADGRRELVINGHLGINAYDPLTGKDLWFCKNSTGRGTPTVVTTAKGLVVAVNGRPGDLLAVRPGGNGQVNETHEAWRVERRGGRDLPSPIVIGDHLLVASLRPGTATCYEAETGKLLDTVRLDGGFSASPIAAAGLAYLPSEQGDVYVLRLGQKIQIVARNRVGGGDETFRASLTPCQGQIFCRSNTALYCIDK